MNKKRKLELESLRDEVLAYYDEGKIAILTIDGLEVEPMENFLKQPIVGILYDLNCLEEVILTDIENPEWVNRFAATKVIRHLFKKLKEKNDD